MARSFFSALVILSFSLLVQSFNNSDRLPKRINITIDEKGLAYIGRDTLLIIGITEEIHIRLWKSYLSTSKMPAMILVTYTGNAAASHQAATEKALKEAQQKTLQQYSVHKYKKKFEETTSSQQRKVKKLFPVLFQQNFTGGSS